MGICSSKPPAPSVAAKEQPAGEPAAKLTEPGMTPVADASPAKLGTGNGTAAEGAGAAALPPSPHTPAHLVVGSEAGGRDQQGCELVTPGGHRYNSAEKPAKSALRPKSAGAEAKSDAKSDFSRRSSSAVSAVGFNVSMDAPECEAHHRVPGADSISLKKIVDQFYDKVVADAELGPFFNGIDMAKLKRHQVQFMALAFGGKELVNEEDPDLNLRRIHIHLIRDKGLSLDHWEQFVLLFEDTLEELAQDIPPETRGNALRSIHATKHYFVPIGEETAYTNQSIAELPEEAEPVQLSRRSGSARSGAST